MKKLVDLPFNNFCHSREGGNPIINYKNWAPAYAGATGSQLFYFETTNISKMSERRPIGIFDSGLGGLTVVRAVRALLPSEDIVYFGDIARLPYGTKSPLQILRCSKDNTEFLMTHKVKALVVACNSSASASLEVLQNCYKVPILADVIRPAAAEAVRLSPSGRIGVMGTQATVRSKVYEKYLKQYARDRNTRGKSVKVYSVAAPLLVSLVETGWLRDSVTQDIVNRYIEPLSAQKIDTLILGCTHVPLLKEAVRRAVGKSVHIIDAAPLVAEGLKRSLERSNLLYSANGRAGKLKVFVSDAPEDFKRIGERFLGEKLSGVKKVSLP